MVKVAFLLGFHQNCIVSNFVLLPMRNFANYQTPIVAPRDTHDTFDCGGKKEAHSYSWTRIFCDLSLQS